MSSESHPSYVANYTKETWRNPEIANSITRMNGYSKNAVTYVPIVIVGAGESGIAAGCKLKSELGFDQFRIFDRQAGIGGTWWINRYPGVACDVPAIFYSFSFAPNHSWSTFHPPGPEIVQYLGDVCRKYEITDKIAVNTDVEGCRWLEDEEVWEVSIRHMAPGTGDLSVKDRQTEIDEGRPVYLKTEKIRAKIVLSCVGGLVEPKSWPNTPGIENFKGKTFHSARWRYDVDFNDKDVVVIGTGCSAAQFVPRLTKAPFNAKSVTQLMRSPPWVVPRPQPPFGKELWEKWSPTIFNNVPGVGKLVRALTFALSEYDMRLFGGSEYAAKEREQVEKSLIRHLKRTVKNEKYVEMLTPNYGVGCKRRIFDASWFPGLNDEKIELTTQPLKSVQERSVTIGPGQTYPESGPQVATDERQIAADVIVLANGFETSKWLHPLNVVGKGGKDLVELMDERGGPQAYQGTAMDGFPNFFMIFGPNTATGHSSVILASENMVNYSLQFVKQILNRDVNTVEVKREAEEAYTADVQKALKHTVWMDGGCSSWYYDKNGWNASVFPYTQIYFTLICMFPKWSHWDIAYTRKGMAKKVLSQACQVLSVAAALVLSYRARKSGQGLGYFKALMQKALAFVAAPRAGVSA